MKKIILKALSVMIFCCVIIAGYTVASSAMVEIVEENFINGTDIAEKIDYNIVNGVTESYIVTYNDDGSNRNVNYVLEVDMSNPEIGVITSYKNYMNGLGKAEWGMQALRDQAVAVEDYYVNTVGNEDFEVVAGVNGDFFNMGNGAPTGTLVMNGIRYNTNNDWPFFALLDDNTVVIGDRGDKPPKNAVQVIGGPEVLLVDGKFSAAVANSGYGKDAHPRTAIGVKANGNIVMLVSDGRQSPESCGHDFNMLAEIMLALGCTDALCLDGGGSSSFISQRDGENVLTLRNSPADGIERTVSTGLLIYTNKDTNKYENVSKWFEKNGKVGYYGADGIPVTGEQTIDGFTYTFDANGNLTSFVKVNLDGTLLKNSWYSTKYYLGADGMPVKGEKKIGNTTFIFNETTGVLEKSDLKNKWCECGTSICYFDANGNKVTGDYKIGTTTYPFDADGKLTAVACVKDDGTLVKNQWLGNTYYLAANGMPRSGGKFKIDGYYYTFGDDGKLIKGELKNDIVNGKTSFYKYYYIAGEKQRNWHMIDGYWYYFDRQTGFGMASLAHDGKTSVDTVKDGLYPISTTDARLEFKFDNNGRLVGGAWLETDYGKAYYWGNHERLLGWQTIEGSKYYFNNDTYAVTGKQIIDGVMYSFDKNGKLEHTYTKKSTVAATCAKDGYDLYVCKDKDCGHEYKEVFKAPGHNFTENVIPSTCAQIGTKTKVCKVCGEKEIEYLEVVPHDNEEVITAPTCTQAGSKNLVCKVCGNEDTEEIAATGHTFENTVIEPTCTQQGYTLAVCSICSHEEKKDFVDVTEHDYEITTTEPTCVKSGVKTSVCKACDYTKTEEIAATGHTYNDTVVKPTCTQQGYTQHICTVCSDSKIDTYTEATGHSYKTEIAEATCTQPGKKTETCACGDVKVTNINAKGHDYDVVTVEATCTTEGATISTCKVCADVKKENVVSAKGHSYTETVTAATCTEKGFTTYTCSVCADSYVENYTDKISHDYSEEVIPPTNEKEGYTIFTCKVCGYSEKGNIVGALDHNYTAVVTAPTCTEDGYTTYSCDCGCGHSYVSDIVKAAHSFKHKEDVAPTCTEKGYSSYVCSACGAEEKKNYVDATAHSFETTEVAPTCVADGEKTSVCSVCGYSAKETIPATGHSFEKTDIAPTCTQQGYTLAVCSVCAAEEKSAFVDATGHDFTTVEVLPTCTEKGYKQAVCSVCEFEEEPVYIAAKGHDFIAVEVAPTCTQQGYTKYTCSVCSAEKIDNYVDATGHNYVSETVEPTCTQPGKIVEKCACGDVKEKTVNAKGHDYEVVVIDVTCTTDGATISTCKVCNDVKTENVVTATGHKYDAVVTEPTTDEKGYTTYTCSLCGDSYESDYVAALGHDYVAVVTPPTCTEDGYTTYTCTKCENDSYKADYVKATGHKYDSTIVDPTCTQVGYITYTCACGDTYKSADIAALGHTESDWIVVTPAQVGVAGKEHKKCSVCSVVLDEREVPALVPTEPEKIDLEVKDNTIKVDNKTKLSTIDAGKTVDSIAKSVANKKYAIVDKDGKKLEKGDLVGTGAKIQLMDNSGNIVNEYTFCAMTDVDGNGKITAADARLALRRSAKLETFDGVYLMAADVTGDDKVTAADARKILRISAGLDKL